MSSDEQDAVLGIFLIVLMGLIGYLTWPIFPILVLSIISWWLLKRHKSVWSNAVASVLFPVSIGLAILTLCLLVFNTLATTIEPAWLRAAEMTLIDLRMNLQGWIIFRWLGFVVLLAVLLIVTYIVPQSKLVTRYLFLKRIFSSVLIVVITLTTFTFFSQHPLDGLVATEHQSMVERSNENVRILRPLLREELNEVGRHLATKSLAKAVQEIEEADKQILEGIIRTIDERAAEVPVPVIAEKQPAQSPPRSLLHEQQPREKPLTVESPKNKISLRELFRSRELQRSSSKSSKTPQPDHRTDDRNPVSKSFSLDALNQISRKLNPGGDASKFEEQQQLQGWRAKSSKTELVDLRLDVMKRFAERYSDKLIKNESVQLFSSRFNTGGDVIKSVPRQQLQSEIIEQRAQNKNQWEKQKELLSIQDEKLREQRNRVAQCKKRTNETMKALTAGFGEMVGLTMPELKEGLLDVLIKKLVSDLSEHIFKKVVEWWAVNGRKGAKSFVEFSKLEQTLLPDKALAKDFLVPEAWKDHMNRRSLSTGMREEVDSAIKEARTGFIKRRKDIPRLEIPEVKQRRPTLEERLKQRKQRRPTLEERVKQRKRKEQQKPIRETRYKKRIK